MNSIRGRERGERLRWPLRTAGDKEAHLASSWSASTSQHQAVTSLPPPCTEHPKCNDNCHTLLMWLHSCFKLSLCGVMIFKNPFQSFWFLELYFLFLAEERMLWVRLQWRSLEVFDGWLAMNNEWLNLWPNKSYLLNSFVWIFFSVTPSLRAGDGSGRGA